MWLAAGGDIGGGDGARVSSASPRRRLGDGSTNGGLTAGLCLRIGSKNLGNQNSGKGEIPENETRPIHHPCWEKDSGARPGALLGVRDGKCCARASRSCDGGAAGVGAHAGRFYRCVVRQ